jgi:hypothetical protein
MPTTLTGKIVTALLLIAAAAALVFGIVHGYEAWRASVFKEGDTAGAARVQARWNEDIKKRDAATLAKVEAARAEGAHMAASAAEGELHAMQTAKARAEQQAAAARRAASAAGGVRDTLAALDRSARAIGVPDAASCPSEFAKQRDDAIRARSVFGACVSAYQVLADRADRDRGDLQLRLDTAMSWIHATGAPGADQVPIAGAP